MKAKFFILALAAVTLSAGSMQAQPPRGPRAECRYPACVQEGCLLEEGLSAEQIARKRADRMTEQLGLSKRQSKQVYSFCLKEAKRAIKAREERREGIAPDGDAPQSRRLVRERCMERMYKILTPEQFVKWVMQSRPEPGKAPEVHPPRRGEMGPGPRAPRAPRAPHERKMRPGRPECPAPAPGVAPKPTPAPGVAPAPAPGTAPKPAPAPEVAPEPASAPAVPAAPAVDPAEAPTPAPAAEPLPAPASEKN